MRANPEIDALLAGLLDSGVSPKYVSRLASELEDHCADLEAEATRLGVPDCDAALDARLRLGNCSVIAQEFELRPELKSWVYKSRWLDRVLRVLGAGYLVVRAPARLAAAGQAIMLRYTAATAAGASVTCAILLMLTAMMPPESTWGVRLVERAGAALGAWELERPRRKPDGPIVPAPSADERLTEPAALPTPAAEPDGGSAQLSQERAEALHSNAQSQPAFERAEPAPRGPLFRPAVLSFPPDLHPAARPMFDRSEARVVLADIEPAAHLGIEDREFKPIIEAAPVYPLAAARRGLEGHVVVEYTVTRTGTVEKAVVIESTHPLFNRAALEAAQEFRYEPRLIRGQAVDVSNVRIMIRFELEA